MHILSASDIQDALAWRPLMDAIAAQFVAGCEMPVRHHHDVTIPGESAGTLLLMPAWEPGEYIGVKVVTIVPENSERNLPAVAGTFLLSSGRTGQPLAIMDGAELTARRTAAASALAANKLARQDATKLLIVGAGKLSLNLLEAHAATRNYTEIAIWARREEQAAEIAEKAKALGYPAKAVPALEGAARLADTISCCTLSNVPLIHGTWLKPGAHLDLIGAFKPSMRESDDEAVRRATIFVDTRPGATKEGGDIAAPIAAGVITEADIAADLYELCRKEHPGRTSTTEITLFKSVGAALEDLAAARLAYETVAK